MNDQRLIKTVIGLACFSLFAGAISISLLLLLLAMLLKAITMDETTVNGDIVRFKNNII